MLGRFRIRGRHWALVLLASLIALSSAAAQDPIDGPEAARLEVTLLDDHPEPRALFADEGDRVTLVVHNRASRSLDFNVDGYQIRIPPIPAGDSAERTFTADKVGRFFYWASAHSHADMGVLEVRARSASGGADGPAETPGFGFWGTLLALVLVPALFGLIGFIEPCSVGANIAFLSYLRGVEGRRRTLETVQFVASRALFLGLVGLAAATIGERLELVQSAYNAVIGAAFLVAGVLYLALRRGWFTLPSMSPGRLLAPKPGKAAFLGAAFGLSAPLCAAPLLFVLVAGSFVLGPVDGFISMAVFGAFLSAPLVPIARSERGVSMLQGLGARSKRTPHVVAALFVAIGVYLLVTGLVYDPFSAGVGHGWMNKFNAWTGRG